MTPLQKLVRVQDIGARLKEIESRSIAERAALLPELRALQEEFNGLIAGTERPPQELMGHIDPATWATAFCERYAGFAPEMMLPWFDAAMASAHGKGRAQGHEEGARSGAQAVQHLIEIAQLVLLLHDQKRHRLGLVRDNTNPDAPPENVAEQLRRALEQLGIEPLTAQ
jgi:hypothetical protein